MVLPADNIVGLYSRHANAWDVQRGRQLYERAWLDSFWELLPDHGHVLDLGCGAAEPIDTYLAEQGLRITGIDGSPALVELARSRLPKHEWACGDMREIDLGRTFDGIIAWDSFFHLTRADQERMFPLFALHAKEGAALMFTSGPENGEAIGSFQGEALYHASLDATEYRQLLGETGFDVVAHRSEDPDCGERTVWLAVKKR